MTTPDSRRQKVQSLIQELQVQAQPGEQVVSDEDYIKWLDYIYRRYVEASGYKSGIKGAVSSLIGQADYDEDLHKQFAFAMMGSIGNDPAELRVREWVGNRFGEEVFTDYGQPAPVSQAGMPPQEIELQDYGDTFTAKNIKMTDLPDMSQRIDAKASADFSTYNAGKNMMADYWKDKWNTQAGSGKVDEFIKNNQERNLALQEIDTSSIPATDKKGRIVHPLTMGRRHRDEAIKLEPLIDLEEVSPLNNETEFNALSTTDFDSQIDEEEPLTKIQKEFE